MACTSGSGCDTTAGICALPDAGFTACDATTPCPTGECCPPVLGICMASGTDLGGFVMCGSVGACAFCNSIQVCSPTTYTCQ